MRFRESAAAHRFCTGTGVEIGGSAHNPFGLSTVNVDALGSPDTVFKQEEIRQCGEAMPVDIVAPGDDIPLPDSSQDFVVSSHVLEHFANPIKALLEWDRIVRPGGTLFMIVPHKDRTFDRDRPRTSLVHLVEDFLADEVAPLDAVGAHQHVWATEDVVELVEWMISALSLAWKLEHVADRDDKVGNGFTLVIRKLDNRDTETDLKALASASIENL